MYSIGQVIFVVLTKKSQVYPMQIVEVITKKTLKGEEVQYVLQGGTDRSTTVMLDQVDGEIFQTAENARETLVSRATSQINKIVDVAIAKSREWYGLGEPPSSTIEGLPDLAPRSPIEMEETRQEVVLPDGTVAKVKLPKIAP